jgi:PrgI family protein
MAVYKVIQDVEAEDKLLGPLTFKSFIYAIIAGTCAFINFKLIILGTPIKWLFILLFTLPMLLFGTLASPLGRDQPTEVWLLSRIRFFLKPRIRVWDQEGMEELVTVTAPKKEEQHLTKDISPTEVRSRLKTLASTMDTRGWAVKNVDTNLNLALPDNPGLTASSDRLVANAGYTQTMPVVEIHPSDDILDERNNPTAQKFAQMMDKADADRKRTLLATMKDLIGQDKKVEDKAAGLTQNAKFEKRITDAKKSLSRTHASRKKASAHHKPATAETSTKPTTDTPKPTAVTTANQAVNMELAQSGSAFKLSTLSQLANRQPQAEQTGPNEITISLH